MIFVTENFMHFPSNLLLSLMILKPGIGEKSSCCPCKFN